MSLMKSISALDNLSYQPKLFINEETRFKNPIGGIISLVSIISIVTIILYFITNFLERKNYSLIYNKGKITNEFFDFEVDFKHFPMILTIGIPGNPPFLD
jgi:hypothetical protein